MSDRSDHLIERAAALLRSANTGQVVEQGGPAGGPGAKSTEPGRGLGAGPAGPPQQPKLSTPPRVAPPAPLPGSIGTSRRAGAALARSASVSDIRAALSHPAIPLAVLERAGLMVARAKRTRTAEEYRVVMGRVLRALHEDVDSDVVLPQSPTDNVVMITSARPGEGKSFTALNLGASVAQHAGDSVLVVDVDAKHDCLTDHLGLGDRAGFFDMVGKPEIPLEDLILPTEISNLFFLPLGRRPGNEEHPAVDQNFEGRRLVPPVARLSARFPKSILVLDAPPCLSTSDPHTLAPSVGQVVMVVEAEKTQRTEIEAAIDMVKDCPNITLLLNKIRTNTSYTFGSYDYFGSYT